MYWTKTSRSHIGGDRPRLKDLYNHVAGNVAAKWKELGVQLLRCDQTNQLDVIAANHPQNVVSRCQCVFENWLQTNVDATWNQLIEALKSPGIQLDYFAGKLEQMLKPECKIT